MGLYVEFYEIGVLGLFDLDLDIGILLVLFYLVIYDY